VNPNLVPARVFLEREPRSGVHEGDGGMMGVDVHQADAGLRPRHLWLIERTANSQVTVPDTRLDSAPLDPTADADSRPASPPASPDSTADAHGRPVSPSVPPHPTGHTHTRPASPPAPPDPIAETLRYLANDVLARPAPPPVTPNGLYAAVACITRGDAATLRKHVVNKAANDPSLARAATDFADGRPMLPGHLNGALVENLNWSLRPGENENTSAGNARDLLGHLIASHLGVNVVIHQGGPRVVLAPLGGHSRSSVEVDLVVVNGQATYRPHT
jgi:hypothetical protein